MATGLHTYRLGAHQSVSCTTTTVGTVTTSFATGTRAIRVVATGAAFIAIGPSVTATTTDVYMPANVFDYFITGPGEKLSAFGASTGATSIVHVTEVS